LEKEYCLQLRETLVKEYREHKVYPAPLDIFRAFELTPFEDVKAVILLQDPYPYGDSKGNPHADGLALSSRSSETPASLRTVLKEVDRDVAHSRSLQEFKSFFPNNDLTPWAKQGVLLINTALTVRAGEPRSHQDIGWNQFMLNVLLCLRRDPKPKVFLLWGGDARTLFSSLEQEMFRDGITPDHKILTTGHPASGSHGKDMFTGCNHFSRCNWWLEKQGIEPIEWRLKRPLISGV